MKPYAEVIGDPIAHSRSPAIHGFWLARLGLDAEYRASHVRPDALEAYFRSRRADPAWRGCNITIPHKQSAIPLVDRLQDEGIGAINCVFPGEQGLVGRNTDAGGLDASLPPRLGAGDRVVLIGGGGAAAAALAALGRRSVHCGLVVRNPDQGRELLARLGSHGQVLSFEQAPSAIAGAAGIVNASPLGMNGYPAMPEALLEAVPVLGRSGFVLDMVYAPLRTALLEAAERAGLPAIDGLAMLIGQAALAFSFFFGVAPPRDEDAALRAMLTS